MEYQIEKIKRVNVSAEVYDQLRIMIFNGNWKSGDKLPSENDLAEMFGVSRITIRQALQKLGAIGLVETRVGEGSFVRELDSGIIMNDLIPALYLEGISMQDVFEFRIMTEVDTAGIAAKKSTPEQVEELKLCYDQMLESKGDLSKYVDLDFHFHRLIISIAGNALVKRVHYILREILRDNIINFTRKNGSEGGVYYHKRIIEAIEQHDAEAARANMREHLTETMERYQKN